MQNSLFPLAPIIIYFLWTNPFLNQTPSTQYFTVFQLCKHQTTFNDITYMTV